MAESLDGSAYVRVDPDDCPAFPGRGLQVVVGRDGKHIRRAEPLLRAAYSARLLGGWTCWPGRTKGVDTLTVPMRRSLSRPLRLGELTTMKRITRFCIRKLHGFRTIDIPIVDNTLILVGENGSGKTTIMRLLYFFLTGQWTSMAAYDFQSVHLDIDTKSYDLTRADITKHPGLGERRSLLHRLPPHVRRRFFDLSNQSDPGALRELERLCIHYDLPVSEVFKDITSETRPLSKQLTKILSALQTSFGTNLLYWPTYRRIEHDLEKILGGLDVSERHRRSLRTHSGQHDYTELVEFGMKDVEVAIANTRTELDQFASVQLNNLSFSYLDDIVEQLDESVDLQQIRDVTSATINKILARIQGGCPGRC